MSSTRMPQDVEALILNRPHRFTYWSRVDVAASILLSLLLVAALWPEAGPRLLVWWFVLWLTLGLRLLRIRFLSRHEDGDVALLPRERADSVMGAAAAGLCWAAVVLCFTQAPTEPSILLLVFVMATMNVLCGATMAFIPKASVTFTWFSQLPVCIWLLSLDQNRTTLIALVYLGVMVFLSRKVEVAVRPSSTASSKGNQVVASAQTGQGFAQADYSLPNAVIHGASHTGVWALDKDYRYLMFNAEHKQYISKFRGVNIEVGSLATDILQCDEFKAFFNRGIEQVSSVSPVVLETHEAVVSNGGTVHEYFEHHSSPMHTNDGSVVGLSFFSHNITHRKRMECAQKESSDFIRATLNAISDNISVKDREHRWVLLNDAFCTMLGHPSEALLGKSDYDVLPKEQADVFWDQDDLVSRTNKTQVNEESLTGADGKTRYLLTQKTPFIFGDGRRFIVATSRDITEHKEIQKDLGDKWKTLLDAQRIARVGSWSVDLVKGSFDWSDEIFRILELDRTQFKANFDLFLDVVHPSDRAQAMQAYQEAIANCAPYENELRLLFRDGRVKHILHQGEPQYDVHGKLVRVIGTSLDITERKRMEEQIRLKEYALDHSGDAIFLIDKNARFTYVNEQACRSLGYSRAQLLQMGTPDIDPDYSQDQAQGANEMAIVEGVITIETRHKRSDGTAFPVEIQLSSLVAYGGHTMTMAAVRDITERRRMQNELIERERELRTLLNNLPDNIARWDAQARFLFVNPAQERVLGKSAKELVGATVPEEFASFKKAIEQVVESAKTLDLRRQFILVGDTVQYHDISLVPEIDDQGCVCSVLGLGRDMTAFYAMQQVVIDRERELRALAESSPGMMGTFYSRPDGSICMPYVSSKIEDLFGLRPEDLVSDATPLFELSHPEDSQRIVESIAESAKNMTEWHEEYRVIHPVKGERWMESNTQPENHPEGGVVWYGYVHDITERKRAQQQFALLERAIDLTADAVFLMNDRLVFTYVNEAACLALGYTRAELLGMGPYEIDADMSREALIKLNQEAPLGLMPPIETRHKTKDGRIFPVEITGVHFIEGGVMCGLTVARNITERKLAEKALQENAHKLEQQSDVLKASREQLQQTEAWYRGILHSAPDGMLVMTEHGTITLVNAQLCRMFGYADEELIGQRFDMLIASDLSDGHMSHINTTIQRMGRRKDGSDFYADMSLSRTPSIEINEGVICVAIRDVTEKQRLEAALAEREHESRTLIDNTPDHIARYNRECMCVFVNQALANVLEGGVEAVLGKMPSEVPGGEQAFAYEAKLREVFSSGVSTEFETTWRDKNGGSRRSHIRLTAEFDSQDLVATVLAVGRDITELHNFRQKIHQMAFYDSLTALPNRALFNDRLDHVLSDSERNGELVGVMMLDLDHFKAINDTLGHPVGDEMLREAAQRLSACVRSYDTVARLGGDEFAILLPNVRSGNDLGRVAGKILAAFNEPFVLDGVELFVSTSIGVAVYPEDGTTPDELIKQADAAMYFTKKAGRNSFHFYSKDLTASAAEKLSLESELRRALERNELELYYQPKIRLSDNTMVGSEALLRWNNPQRGMVPPIRFIPIAEDSGLIVKIGEWVLRDAIRTACEWNGDGKPVHKVAINLSARQFQSHDLVDTVREILAETGCQTQWIELEITESLLLDEQGKVLDMLKSFSAMGITIAIDDFGTGYSSLSYLARFPINTLKIDRSFINDITTEKFHGELVKAILSIAQCLGHDVVAEGVETQEQAAFLRAHGCQVAQGYLYSKPIPKAALEATRFTVPQR